MSFADDVPYRIEPRGESRVVVEFAPICDHFRTRRHEDELMELLGRYEAIACDLSRTESIGSEWLRWLKRMTAAARRMGKKVALVGVQDAVRESADVLGLQGELLLVSNIEEVWGS